MPSVSTLVTRQYHIFAFKWLRGFLIFGGMATKMRITVHVQFLIWGTVVLIVNYLLLGVCFNWEDEVSLLPVMLQTYLYSAITARKCHVTPPPCIWICNN